jgi:hypothetical protein
LKEDTMSAASEVNAYRPIAVLLGGPFAAQCSIEPKPVVCALLRGWARLADAAGHLHPADSAAVVAPAEVGHHG